jgi:adenylate cyclase
LEKGAAMTDRKGNSLEILGYLYALKGDYDKAIEVGEQAIAMIPNGADAYAWLAMSLNVAGRPEEAPPLFQKAMRLNPLPPAFYYLNCGNSYRVMGRFEEALTLYKKAIQLTPNNAMAHMNLAATYGLMGREEEARAAAAALLRINPKFSVEYAIQIFPVQASYIDQLAHGLRKAGLK